jgi:DNA-binding NarL/FixJ family response regulator
MQAVHLTPRETQVLELLFTGKRDKEAADLLNVTTSAIKWHCTSMYKKFHASNRTEVIYKALQLGLLKPPQQLHLF